MITCNSCGTENTPGSIYCEDCGAQLESEESGVRSPATPLEPGTVLEENFTIESLLEGGAILRYRARNEEGPVLLLEARQIEGSSLLSSQKALLECAQDGFVQPFQFFSYEGYDYAVAAWPGTRLEDLEAPLVAAEVSQILMETLQPLKTLHAQGLVSRSLQPSRLWRGPEGTIVVDLWERCCRLQDLQQSEELSSVTPGYSAPEMYGLGTQDARLDLFSLGAVGYFLLTGERLQLDSRESFFVIAPPQVEGAEGLIRVLMKALRKSPEERFADAASMLAALQDPSSLTEVETAPVPAPSPKPLPPPPANLARNGRSLGMAPEVAMMSHIGCVRKINQDACLEIRFSFYEKSQRSEGWLVTVIDGMGGEAEGDKAASLALRTLAQEIVAADLSLRDGRKTTVLLPDDLDQRCYYILERAIRVANRTIYDYASLDENRRGMGCTMTACLLTGSKAYFAQVGDTRGYHGRERLTQITTDHSLVGRLVAMGSLTPEEARVSPQRSIIYRALGTNPDVDVDLFQQELLPGDRIVLCSDGVWEYFEASEFEGLVMTPRAPAELCKHLVDLCLSRGADDNATVAVIQC